MIRTLTAMLCLLPVVTAQDETEKPEAPVAQTTKSGLKYWVLRGGQRGTKPQPGDKVRVDYTGWLENGRKFDSSIGKKPFELMVGVGAVIDGWDEGLQLMNVGSKFKFHIPWQLAYGEKGRGPIPAKADLIFEVELLKVTAGDQIPKHRAANLEKQVATKSGLKYEMVKAGDGVTGGKDQMVKIKFVIWNGDGRIIMCTQASNMHIGGMCSAPALPGVPPEFNPKFFAEAVGLMSKGAVARFEVPANLCWGDRQVHPKLPPNSTTYWHMEVTKIVDLPKFVLTPEANLKKTSTGLMYEVLQEGTGKQPGPTDQVTVHYSGWTTDGKQFDSSWARDTPAEFPLDRVIPGWTEGLQLMKEGARYRFRIPGGLAYDVPGARPGTPKGTLIFTVQLIKVGK